MTRILFKISDIIALCFLIPLFAGSFFVYRSIDFETMRESTSEVFVYPMISLVETLALLGVLLLIIKTVQRYEKSRQWHITYVIMGFCAVVTIIFGHWWIVSNPFEPVADQEKVWQAAVDIANGAGRVSADLVYFQEYPQQKPMAVLMSVWAHVFHGDLILYDHMNLIFIAATVILMSLCAKAISDRPVISILISLLLTSFIPFTLYSKFIYGSVPAIFFTVLSAYGMLCYFKGRSVRWLILSVISVPLAVMLYQSELIFLIASVIIMIMGTLSTRRDRSGVIICIVTVVLIIILTCFMTYMTEKLFTASLGKSETGGKGIPPTGHMLMGLMAVDDNMPGNYNGASQRIYEELGYDTDAADAKARQLAAEALRDFVTGNRSLKFFLVKTECQWLDPWFGGITMNVYDAEYRGAYDNEKWDSFLYGKLPMVMQGYLRLLMTLIYGGAAFCILNRIIKGHTANLVGYLPSIYFVGGFTFQFIWEQKSRYCLPYYLGLFPLAACGIYCMSQKCDLCAAAWDRRKKIYVFAGAAGFIALMLAGSLCRSIDCNTEIYKDNATGVYRSRDMHLPKGDYGIVLHYQTGEDIVLQLYLDNGGTAYPVELSYDDKIQEIPAYMQGYKDNVHFEFDQETAERLILDKLHVYSPGIIYMDCIYLAAVFAAIMAFLYRIYDPEEMRQRKAAVLAAVLLLPASLIIGRFIHIPVLCRLLRVSAAFSVFIVLFALYTLIVCAVFNKDHRIRKKAAGD